MAECYSETCNERQLRWETDLWWDTTFTVTWPYISIHLRLQWKTTWHIRPLSVGCLSSQVSLYMQFPSCLFWKVARLDIYLSQICCLSYMIVDLLLYISVDCGHPSLLMRRQTWAVKDSPTPSCPILVCMQCSSISKYRIHFDTLHPLKLDFNLSHTIPSETLHPLKLEFNLSHTIPDGIIHDVYLWYVATVFYYVWPPSPSILSQTQDCRCTMYCHVYIYLYILALACQQDT